MISLIWAMDEGNVIGLNNKIPWHIKEDLLYYKSKTSGRDVLMGYNTYLSLKGYYKDKPLPYNNIYVATRSEVELSDAKVVSDVESFLKEFKGELFVVGGAQIYTLALSYADFLYVSLVKGHHEGDAYFPKLDLTKFDLVSQNSSSEVIYKVYKRGE